MPDDETRISEFKKALRQYSAEGIVDLDKNYRFKFNFQIHRLEDILQNSRMATPPNRWSYYRICFLTEGDCEVITGIYKFRAEKNTFYVIPARVIASSKKWAVKTRGFVLLFNIDFFLENKFSHQFIVSKKLLSTSNKPYLHLNQDQGKKVTIIFEDIMAEKKHIGEVNYELIAVKILELLLLGERLFAQARNVTPVCHSVKIIKQFVDLLDSHFSKEHSVKFMPISC